MMYAKGHLVNGKLITYGHKIIDETKLTSDCFILQLEGADACKTCENLNKPRKCGGMALRGKYGVPPPVVKKRKPSIDTVTGKSLE